jgi:DNA-binding transcriptional LysR family regulator
VEAEVGIAMLPFHPPRGSGVRVLQLSPPVPQFRVGYAFNPHLGGMATVVRPLLDEILST